MVGFVSHVRFQVFIDFFGLVHELIGLKGDLTLRFAIVCVALHLPSIDVLQQFSFQLADFSISLFL